MKVIDVINLTAKLLNEIDVKNCTLYCLKNDITIDELIDNDEINLEYVNTQSIKDLRIILDCINIVLTKIATENYPIITCEEIQVDDNKFKIENLSQKLFKIKDIYCNFMRQKYFIRDGYICIPTGKYNIKYAILPKEVGFDDELQYYAGKLSILTIGYGVCECFALIKGMYDESEMWKEKFDSALQKNFTKIRDINIKKRRWI